MDRTLRGDEVLPESEAPFQVVLIELFAGILPATAALHALQIRTATYFSEVTSDPIEMYLQDIFTIPANLAGLPGISFPCGQNNNLPIGLQLVGNSLQEGKLLMAAHKFQQVTDWHKEMPNL